MNHFPWILSVSSVALFISQFYGRKGNYLHALKASGALLCAATAAFYNLTHSSVKWDAAMWIHFVPGSAYLLGCSVLIVMGFYLLGDPTWSGRKWHRRIAIASIVFWFLQAATGALIPVIRGWLA